MKKTTWFAIPVIVFAVLIVFLFQGLFSDPRDRGSMALGKPFPTFALPDLFDPGRTYTPEDFKGEVTILNVWGVWCVTCAVELPYFCLLSTSAAAAERPSLGLGWQCYHQKKRRSD